MCTVKGERTVPVCDVAPSRVRQEIAGTVASGDAHGGVHGHRGMPSAALRTGCANVALPLDRIASAVVAQVMVPGAAALLRVPLRGRDSAADEAMHNG